MKNENPTQVLLAAQKMETGKQDVASKQRIYRCEGPASALAPVLSVIQTTQSDQAPGLEHNPNSHICIFPEKIAETTQILTYKCSLWTRRTVILSMLNQPIFHILPKTVTMTRERQLQDATNCQTLMTIHRHIWTAGPPYYTFLSPSGVQLLRLDRRWQLGTSRMVASFINTLTSQLQNLTIDGNWSSTKATVRDAVTDAVIADFRLNLKPWKHTYTVTIKTGIDIALILGMLACFDDRDGGDFHFAEYPKGIKLARQKNREYAAEQKRQVELSGGSAPGHLDGAVADMVRQHRKVCTRSLHRRERRFRGPGRHLQRIEPDQDLRKAKNAANTNTVAAANLAVRA